MVKPQRPEWWGSLIKTANLCCNPFSWNSYKRLNWKIGWVNMPSTTSIGSLITVYCSSYGNDVKAKLHRIFNIKLFLVKCSLYNPCLFLQKGSHIFKQNNAWLLVRIQTSPTVEKRSQHAFFVVFWVHFLASLTPTSNVSTILDEFLSQDILWYQNNASTASSWSCIFWESLSCSSMCTRLLGNGCMSQNGMPPLSKDAMEYCKEISSWHSLGKFLVRMIIENLCRCVQYCTLQTFQYCILFGGLS